MEYYDTHTKEETSWSKIFNPVIYVIENYGWYILIAFVLAAVIYNRTLKAYWQKYKEYKFEREYAAKYHKNPDLFEAHINAREKWVQKMQEKYNNEAEEHQKKMKEREEKKKQELMDKYGNSGGQVLGGTKKDDHPTNLRQDYNPLMGGGSSSSYRPPRRSPCGGGGCGK